MFSCNIFIAATCIVLAALFCFILYLWIKRNKSEIKPIVVGMATFLMFSIIFENIAHTFFLTVAEERAQMISESFLLYLFYGCSMAGVFEETGRYFAFKYILPRDSTRTVAISYGIGHGGIELLLSGVLLLLISGPEKFGVSESFLWISERLIALLGHGALSIIVFVAVKRKYKSLLIVAIILHGIADIPIGLYKFGIINQFICCMIFAFLVSGCCLVARKCWKLVAEEGRENEALFDFRME